MKKYIPSVKNNNALRDNIVNELKAVAYRLGKGKSNVELDKDTVESVAEQLKTLTEMLENSVCTGSENIELLANDAEEQLKELKKQMDQPMTHRLESAADELFFTIGLWKDVLDGNAVMETPEEIRQAKISRSRRKLDARLDELAEIKQSFAENGKRLDKEVRTLEKDLAEYENAMLDENNERKINELFRNVKAVKSKIDMLTVRQNNYSACYNLLDMIFANAKEILQATDFAAEEISKAKALLNIDRLKKVLTEPDKAVVILKRMDAEIKTISARTATLDSKVFGLDSGAATVSADAMKYKEELMRKKREKEALANASEEITQSNDAKTKIDTEG